MNPKYLKRFEDPKESEVKKLKLLLIFVDNGTKTEIQSFYGKNYSMIYKMILDALQELDKIVKNKKGNKTISSQDITVLTKVMSSLFKYSRYFIKRKWQQRSIIQQLELFLEENNVMQIRQEGFELLLEFLDIMMNDVDEKIYDLLLSNLGFETFVENEEELNLSEYNVRKICSSAEKFRFPKSNLPQTPEDSLKFLNLTCNMMINTQDSFEFWWDFFKTRVAVILYPIQCKKLKIMDVNSLVGFQKSCPFKIHLEVIAMLETCINDDKKRGIICNTDIDMQLIFAIWKQSFSILPPEYYHHLISTIKLFKNWINASNESKIPTVMLAKIDEYYKIIIDTIQQPFFIEGNETFKDVHVKLSYDILDIFFAFNDIEHLTESTIIKIQDTYMGIYRNLMRLHNDQNPDKKYNVEYSKMMERVTMKDMIMWWIKSSPKIEEFDEHWKKFKTLIQDFFHMTSVFSHWRNSFLNLTNAVIQNVYKLPRQFLRDYEPLRADRHILTKVKGKKYNVEKEKITTDQDTFLLNIPEDHLLYLWHRFKWFFESPLSKHQHDLTLYSQQLEVIGQVIDRFNLISHTQVKVPKGHKLPPFVHSPEGNTLGELFLKELLAATEIDDPNFIGSGTVYTALCTIFCEKYTQPILPKYLACFYKAIMKGLNHVNSTIQYAILWKSWSIFSFSHKGSFILIPEYVKICEYTIKNGAADHIVMAAIRCLTSLIFICFYNSGKPIPCKSNVDDRFKTFDSVLQIIVEIFVIGLKQMKNENCLIRLAWGLHLYLHKSIKRNGDKELERKIISGLVPMMTHDIDNVANSICDIFTTLSHMNQLEQLEPQLLEFVLKTSCVQIRKYYEEENMNGFGTPRSRWKILHNIVYLLIEMVSNIPFEMLVQNDVATSLFSMVEVTISAYENVRINSGLTENQSPLNVTTDEKTKQLHRIKIAGEALLTFLTNIFRGYPSPGGSEVISSNYTEFDIVEQDAGKYVHDPRIHHFIYNKYTILTVLPSKTCPESVVIVARDMTGRYVWESKLISSPNDSTFRKSIVDDEAEKIEFKNEQQLDDDDTSTADISEAGPRSRGVAIREYEKISYPHYHPDIDTNQTDMVELLQYFISDMFPDAKEYALESVRSFKTLNISYEDTLKELRSQYEKEQELLKVKKNNMETGESFPPALQPKKPNLIDGRLPGFSATRHLLYNMGLLSKKSQSRFYRLPSSAKLYRFLKHLDDKNKEREAIKVGLVYVKNGHESQSEILCNNYTSDLFNQFCQGLGWEIDLKTHRGFDGGLDTNGVSTGATAPYFATPTTELTFHVVTNMPTKENDTVQVIKKRHVGNDIVHVVWSEHDTDYRPWTMPSQFNFVHIIIYPLTAPLYRVQIFQKQVYNNGVPIPELGPLMHNMIVDHESLAPLVRQTAINANKVCRYTVDAYLPPFTTRRKTIDELIEKYNPTSPGDDFYYSLFENQEGSIMIPSSEGTPTSP